MKKGLIGVLAISLLLGSAAGWADGKPEKPQASKAPASKALPMEQLRAFAEIFGRIKKDYVEPVDDKKLLEFAIRGMLSGLDPHSSYLSEKEFTELQEGTQGEFGGLGIEVGIEDGFIKVIAPIDDTPAQKAGILAGDLIIRLDEQPVKGMDLEEAVGLMRGKPGSEITLTIMREGEEKPLKITLKRAVIKVASVKSRMLEPGYGYVRLSNFQARTTEEMLKHISQLKEQAKGALSGLVLDLRNNPGGVLNGAVAVSDAFLSEGRIVYTEGRAEDSRLEFKAAPDDVLEGAPIVVLVNGGSASASEIVAGALQDQRRAIIMGSRTFGKGSVQTIIPINQHAALKLTTARYYTPSGRSIQAEGIVPDIQLDAVEVKAGKRPAIERVKEANLSRHLENPDHPTPDKGEKAKQDEKDRPLVEEDYPLYQALTLLKGLTLMQGAGG